MSCERWEHLLSPYLDGELPASEKEALAEHLEVCRPCREELETFRALSRVLSVRTEPDPFFITRFRARRDEELGVEGSWMFWHRLAVRLLPLAVAALLGAVATIWLSVEEVELGELEARELGGGFTLFSDEEPYPVLQIAFEPLPLLEEEP